MPKNKDLKRLVRSRMTKTGEAYTTARTQLLKKRTAKPATQLPEVDYASRAGMSDAAVTEKTGHPWKEWVRRLDSVGASEWKHRDIAEHVHDNYSISGWWAQAVTVGYERIRGLRQIGQRREGSFEASKSRTFPVPVRKLYEAFASARVRNRWLAGHELTVRKTTPDRSVRITWSDGTPVEAWIVSKGDSKSQVAVQHRKLPSQADAARVKAFWDERLKVLAEQLSS
jgi:hypothetical protein